MQVAKPISPVFTESNVDFESHFVEINGHQIHYIEAGQGDPILYVHGNPTSSYAYRNILEPVANATNHRCIALDLLGFGKSDKPNVDYSCELHSDILIGFIEKLGLNKITLVAEDWGGFLSGYVMTQMSERFSSAVFMETFLWPMTWEEDVDPKIAGPFKLMRSPLGFIFTRGMNMMVNKVIPEHCPISDESLQYYKDSLPDFKSRKAMGAFPGMIPLNQKPRKSYNFAVQLQEGLKNIKFPVLWLVADPGVIVSNVNPIGMGRLEELKERLPQMEVKDFGEGYHFLTEEDPEKVARFVSDWVNQL